MQHAPLNPETSLRQLWSIPQGVTYLNHGSFGPSPVVVQQCRDEWSQRLEANPMDFFLRRMEDHLEETCAALGRFVGAPAGSLILVENATVGMNVVAANVPLAPGDEVLLTDHEYGAVQRTWREACARGGARPVAARLPLPLVDAERIADAIAEEITDKTRLVVVSQITSPTAAILPVERICRRAKERDVPVCIDGPHAVAHISLNIASLGCDFYAASCHKWLCAPFGSGFLYVAPHRQQHLKPVVTSWGGSIGGRGASWKDEFTWSGTRDPAALLSIPRAIEFLDEVGLDRFRQTSHDLAGYARAQLTAVTGLEALVPDDPAWYGAMIALPLPPLDGATPKHGRPDPLQTRLWEDYRIEIPVVHWRGQRLLRVSCHLYNSRADIDLLAAALRSLL